jgi:hypothetical protein
MKNTKHKSIWKMKINKIICKQRDHIDERREGKKD